MLMIELQGKLELGLKVSKLCKAICYCSMNIITTEDRISA